MAITATTRVHPATAFTPPLFLAFALGVRSYWIPGSYVPALSENRNIIFKAIEK